MVYVQFFNSMGDKVDEYEVNTKDGHDGNFANDLAEILRRNMTILFVGDTIKIVEE